MSEHGRRSSAGRRKPDLVVPAEARESVEVPVELPIRGNLQGGGDLSVTSVDSGDGAEEVAARPVGTIPSGRKKFSYSDEPIPVSFKLDPAVHFALRLVNFETGMDQQYLINLALKQFCRDHGVDPDALREGKGYTVSFPAAGTGA